MIINDALSGRGFALDDVTADDFDTYYATSRTCYEKYVDEYFGGWKEDVQIPMNRRSFDDNLHHTCFKKIIFQKHPVGFLAYDIQDDRIEELSIQMTHEARNYGLGSAFLRHVKTLSDASGKPAYLQVFKSNPAKALYERFGYVVYDENHSHYQMVYGGETGDL